MLSFETWTHSLSRPFFSVRQMGSMFPTAVPNGNVNVLHVGRICSLISTFCVATVSPHVKNIMETTQCLYFLYIKMVGTFRIRDSRATQKKIRKTDYYQSRNEKVLVEVCVKSPCGGNTNISICSTLFHDTPPLRNELLSSSTRCFNLNNSLISFFCGEIHRLISHQNKRNVHNITTYVRCLSRVHVCSPGIFLPLGASS